ncbi:hypothetical protein FWF48_02835 [Candidatus Saccharibacteria bacterium]|nr:hypothetical protein [Candidatus Saccharibacteria bacterium]
MTKKATIAEVEEARRYWEGRGAILKLWQAPDGTIVKYHLISCDQFEDDEIPARDASMVTYADKDHYFVGILMGTSTELRGFCAWHEMIEWSLIDENGKGYPWCPYTEQWICQQIDDPELLHRYHANRAIFFDDMVTWGKKHPSDYDADDVEVFSLTAEYHRSQL